MHEIKVVYATSHCVVSMPDGTTIALHQGSHYPADDPVVRQYPGAFSPDPRYGMHWTGDAPFYMALPPDAPIVEQATSRPGEMRQGPRRG